jgi:hypothetical protein
LRWESGPRARGLEQALQKCVLILQCLDAPDEIIHFGFEQLDLLGELAEAGKRFLGPLQASSEGSANGRVHDDSDDRDQ